MYTYRIEQAIRAAAVLHREQETKGSIPFPYITHLVAVAFTLMDYTDDEDVIIAALLHDTLDSSDYSKGELREDFGARVGEIVEGVTQENVIDGRRLGWMERNKNHIRSLKNAPQEVLLVSAASKVHILRTVVEDYLGNKGRFFQDFGKNYDERVEIYEEFGKVYNSLDNPIKKEYAYVLGEYKNFIEEVRKEEDRFYGE